MKNYILAKKIVSSKYDESYKYYSLLVTAMFVILNKYPDYHNMIIELFMKTDMYLEDESVYEIIKNNNIFIENFDSEEEKICVMSSCPGTSSQGYTFKLDQNYCFIINKDNPFIICSMSDESTTFLLNLFIHEFNHLVKGVINSYKIDNDSFSTGYYLRSGLDIVHTRLIKSNDTLYEINYHSILDEVINTVQTTEMMEDVMMLDGIVPDSKIQVFINSLDKDELKKDFGYELCVKAFRPLWKNENFKNLVEDNIVDGNIKYISKIFDGVAGYNSFEEMADILDDLDEIANMRFVSVKKVLLLDQLKKIINSYNKKTNYTYKK